VQLLESLAADDERPWADWKDGKPITAHGLGRLLRGYHVKSGRMRPGGRDTAQGRGYRRADFESAWERHVPVPPQEGQSVTPSHGGASEHDSPRSEGPAGDGVTLEPPFGRSGAGDVTAAAEGIFGPWINGHTEPPLPEDRPGPDDDAWERAP
jgi:hypothetical protein